MGVQANGEIFLSLEATFSALSAFYKQIHLLTEPELIRTCLSGDQKAQRELFGRFAGPMLRVASRYVRDPADTEDVLMMAFMRVLANLNGFTPQGPGSLEAWIRKVVVNEALMWLRRRHNFHMTESLEEGHAIELTELSRLPAEDILRFVDRLPNGYRTVFNLNVVEGYAHHEIAELLNISESTSRTQLFKAKGLLKKMLTQEGYHYGT
jgi:RNA polymerase sigma-70 factor (ECF subfamily)